MITPRRDRLTVPNIRTLLLDYRRAYDAMASAEVVYDQLRQKKQDLLRKIKHQAGILKDSERSFRETALGSPEATDIDELLQRYRDAHAEHARLTDQSGEVQRAILEASDQLEIKHELLKEGQTALNDYIARCPLGEIDSLARVIDPRPPPESEAEPEGHPS